MKKGLLTMLIGAGIGAVAILLSKKENRDKAIKAYNDFMDGADDSVDRISTTAEKARKNNNISNGVTKLRDLLN